MKRSPLTTDPDKARAWQQRSRRPLPAQSERRASGADERAVIRQQVIRRDGDCRIGALLRRERPWWVCCGPRNPHHRRKASQGGAYSLANLVLACNVCNDALEADADLARWAHGAGLVVKRSDPEWGSLGA